MKIVPILALLALATSATAQVIFQPVRYQYGAYNEVFYGGQNPAFTTNPYVYLPPALQSAYSIQRLSAEPGVNPYLPYGAQGPFVSPFTPGSNQTTPAYVPYIFSDYLPYQEVGQFGYTVDDARNEAYANAPRLQTGYRPPEPAAPEAATGHPAAAPAAAEPVTDPRSKAIPLLDWAKVERTRNPELYKALIEEAKKYDPAATDTLERSFASEK